MAFHTRVTILCHLADLDQI